MDTNKSTFGYIFTIDGTVVSWMSKLQKCISLLTTDAEHVTMSETDKDMVWLTYLLEDIRKKQYDKVFFSAIQSFS